MSLAHRLNRVWAPRLFGSGRLRGLRLHPIRSVNAKVMMMFQVER
jgi:hypothetical protein